MPDQDPSQIPDDSATRRRRGPRKATPEHLRNAALHYLERFASSEDNLRRVLMRKVRRSAHHHGTDTAEGEAAVEDIIRRFRETGLLDDTQYAEARARSLRDRGQSARSIRFKLIEKGIAAAEAEQAIGAIDGADSSGAEREAAVRYARKRRLGPFADPARRAERREKDLAAMARAGFSFDTAQEVVDADPEDVADEGRTRL